MRRVEPPKLAKVVKREQVTRNGSIEEWSFQLSAYGADRDFMPKRWSAAHMSALGTFSEAVNGIDAFETTFVGVDAEAVEANTFVGKLLRAKPVLKGAVSLAWPDFNALATFAAAGRPLYCSTRFEKPRYGLGDILSFTVSTKPLE